MCCDNCYKLEKKIEELKAKIESGQEVSQYEKTKNR